VVELSLQHPEAGVREAPGVAPAEQFLLLGVDDRADGADRRLVPGGPERAGILLQVRQPRLVALEAAGEGPAEVIGHRAGELLLVDDLVQAAQGRLHRGRPRLVAEPGLVDRVRAQPEPAQQRAKGQALAQQGDQHDQVGQEQQQVTRGERVAALDGDRDREGGRQGDHAARPRPAQRGYFPA
jgi:hypothetical protein